MNILTKQPWWVMALIIVLLVLIIGTIWYKNYINSIKGGESTVVSQTKVYEIREYEPMIVAQVELENKEFRQGASAGFQILAGYIFGNNEAKQDIAMTSPVLDEIPGNQKIAMTSPVLDEMPKGGKRVFSFLMPDEFTLDSLPTPKDERVILKELPARKVAVISFNGIWSDDNFTKHYKKLVNALTADGIKFEEGFTRASYDPPITPPMLRTNEIHIKVMD